MHGTKTSKVLLVEGIAGVGKSTLIDKLIRKYVRDNGKLRTFLHLTQAHTYGPLAPDEDAGTLTPAMNAAHLEHIGDMIDFFVAAMRGMKPHRNVT
jgi:thymidylate kinase